MNKLLVQACGVALAAALLAPLAPESAAKQEPPALVGVPIGGILLWWGRYDEIPEGFEACDGRQPNTRDAVFRDRKPDFQRRFPKGADDMRSFVPQNYAGGGNAQLSFEVDAHELTLEEIPGHTHGLQDHVHPIAPHTHDVDPAPLPLTGHDHTLGDSVTVSAAASGTDVVGTSGTANSTGSTPLTVDIPTATTTANTAGLTTLASSIKETGRAGGQKPKFQAKGHTHAISTTPPDLRPPYLDVIYIIRVK